MEKSKKLKITWSYRYVPDGQLEPDERGRWAIDGYLETSIKKALPRFQWLWRKDYTHSPIRIAIIHQKEIGSNNRVPSLIHRFGATIPSLDDPCNSGLCERNYFGDTVEEVQQQVEEAFNVIYTIFSNAKMIEND